MGQENPQIHILDSWKIGVEKSESGVFKPFNTLSCLIGIGADYEAETVGTTCEVCSKNQQCEMRWFDI